jgi:hypothetical protein
MKLTRKQLRHLIREMALAGMTTGVENPEGGLDFKEGGPTDEEYYGVIAQGLKESEEIEKLLKDSAIDVNIIVVPEQILKPLTNYVITFTPDLFETDIDTGMLSRGFQSMASSLKGQSKMLENLRKQYRSDSFNVVVQREDKDNAGFIFSVPWVLHDTIGHALNFSAYGTKLEAVADLFITLLSGGEKRGASFNTGTGFETAMKLGAVGEAGRNIDLNSRLQKFFVDTNFTANPFDFDVGASIIAYYFIYGELPPPVQDAIDDGEIDAMTMAKYKLKMDNIFKSLIGNVGYVNFGPHSKAMGT